MVRCHFYPPIVRGGLARAIAAAAACWRGRETHAIDATPYVSTQDGNDITNDKRAVQKLRREVERVKRALSNQHQARLEIESLYDGNDFSETLTRARFEELNLDLFKKTLGPVGKVMEDGDLAKTEIDELVLVGGSTRIPAASGATRRPRPQPRQKSQDA